MKSLRSLIGRTTTPVTIKSSINVSPKGYDTASHTRRLGVGGMSPSLIVMTLFTIACHSGNSVRNDASKVCQNVRIPIEAIANPNEVLRTKTGSFVPANTYNAMVDHAEKLMLCGTALSCVIEHTEYERDCEKSKSFVDRSFGLSCDLEKPTCKVRL